MRSRDGVRTFLCSSMAERRRAFTIFRMVPTPANQDFNDQTLQQLCEEGSEALVRTQYLQAEHLLAKAEHYAWAARDWDTLSRLYMPLQECRRQRRQRCGEGQVVLDLVSRSAAIPLDAEEILSRFSAGQLLVAGWGTIEPAQRLRELADERGLYVETFLAAAYSVQGLNDAAEEGVVVVIVPTAETTLPNRLPAQSWNQLSAQLPPGSRAVPLSSLPVGVRQGNPRTYAQTMSMWEGLHAAYLAAADAETDPVLRMTKYREVIRVDYACELAHQKLSATAAELMRREATSV